MSAQIPKRSRKASGTVCQGAKSLAKITAGLDARKFSGSIEAGSLRRTTGIEINSFNPTGKCANAAIAKATAKFIRAPPISLKAPR